ncbi:type II toxin-antitoxin system RelE/ParE family toxin [Streptomyces sp. NPDC096033]|uniref:type II toxin-antitoxin system RelE family toxin n=1 Tax=Streptomyces sp. NPDC096033 TaxID=3366071 RepID=UPI0038264915
MHGPTSPARPRSRIVWETAALEAAARFLRDDPAGVRLLVESADLLPCGPRPAGTAAYGSPDVRRMHAGRYRLLYRVTAGGDDGRTAITVLHVGRIV